MQKASIDSKFTASSGQHPKRSSFSLCRWFAMESSASLPVHLQSWVVRSNFCSNLCCWQIRDTKPLSIEAPRRVKLTREFSPINGGRTSFFHRLSSIFWKGKKKFRATSVALHPNTSGTQKLYFFAGSTPADFDGFGGFFWVFFRFAIGGKEVRLDVGFSNPRSDLLKLRSAEPLALDLDLRDDTNCFAFFCRVPNFQINY